MRVKKQELGQFFTTKNPFNYNEFNRWLEGVPKGTFLEPFVGSWDIPKHLGLDFDGYDIDPKTHNTAKQNTIKEFPKGYKVCITNPPYLAKNSATRQKLAFPSECIYDDVYKYCLKLMLDNCEYVAVIIPETFIISTFNKDRLISVISFDKDMFDDTTVPACLALFGPEKTDDFGVFFGNEFIGNFNEINYISSWPTSRDWTFNDANGEIGLKGIDKGGNNNDIHICLGSDLDIENKATNRYYATISNKKRKFTDKELSKLLEESNKLINKLRLDTGDIIFSAFKNRRPNGKYRRRIPFKLVNKILTKACTYLK